MDDHPVLLYDGLCPVCNRLNLFVLRRDPHGRFRFAPLQSAFAQATLKRHGRLPLDLDTIYAVLRPGTSEETLLQRGQAAVFVLRHLGGGWRWLGALLKLLPNALLTWGYDRIARNRYRWGGRYQQCVLPQAQWLARFIEPAP